MGQTGGWVVLDNLIRFDWNIHIILFLNHEHAFCQIKTFLSLSVNRESEIKQLRQQNQYVRFDSENINLYIIR